MSHPAPVRLESPLCDMKSFSQRRCPTVGCSVYSQGNMGERSLDAFRTDTFLLNIFYWCLQVNPQKENPINRVVHAFNPSIWRQRQPVLREFKAHRLYITNSGPTMATQRDPIPQPTKQQTKHYKLPLQPTPKLVSMDCCCFSPQSFKGSMDKLFLSVPQTLDWERHPVPCPSQT